MDTIRFVLESVTHFFMLLLILRFLMQVARVPFQQPLGQFTVKMSNWLVLPLRRFLPGVAGYDTASLVGTWLLGVVLWAFCYLVLPPPISVPTLTGIADPIFWVALFLLGLLELITVTVYCLFGAILIQAVLSWINPYHPLGGSLRRLTQPLLTPFQRLVPVVAGVDLSPLVVLLLFQVVLMGPVPWVKTKLLLLLYTGVLA